MTRAMLYMLAGGCLSAVLWGSAGAARPEPGLSDAVVRHCQVLLIRDVDVPATETGLLVGLHVEEGAAVVSGQPLAQLDDTQAVLQQQAAQLERDAALARAADDIEVRYAVKSFELAEAELNQSLEINRKSPGAVPVSEIRRLQLARHRAELQIDRSRLELRVAQMNADVHHAAVRSAEESISRRRIVAPFDGMVVELFRQANEWVNAGEPVMRLVRLDELSVDGFLSGEEFDVTDVAGAEVTVEVDLARGRRERFEGQIVFVNPLIQAGNKFRVRATVANRKEQDQYLLRPGMPATMHIHRR